jgi:hypothetical protein
MKRIVLIFGLIAGAVLTVVMFGTMPFLNSIGYNLAMTIGYTTMVLSFLTVFFGVRSYRENINGGVISFGRAFAVGILITLIGSAVYVLTWEIMYFGIPGLKEKFIAMCVTHLRNSNAPADEIARQMEMLKMLDNPFINAAMVFLEPFPVGLVITLISAVALRKKPPMRATENQPLAV